MVNVLETIVILTATCFTCISGQHVCTTVESLGNINYRFHQIQCNEFIQCHESPNGNIYAVYMSCPFGQLYDQSTKTCQNTTSQTCGLGTCLPSSRLEDGGCRAYSQCLSARNHIHQCCEPGFRYMGGRCQPDSTCTDPCPGTCATGEMCRSYPHWSNPTLYYHYHREENAVYKRVCPRGSHYDMVECGCIAPRRQFCYTPYVLRFTTGNTFVQSGSIWTSSRPLSVEDSEAMFDTTEAVITGNINLGKPSLENPLVIKLRYRNILPTNQFETIFLSTNCRRCNHLRIGRQGDQFIARLSVENNDVAEISMETAGFDTLSKIDAVVVYNGRELTAAIRSGNLNYMKKTKAPRLTVMDCGMQVSEEGSAFRGRLESIAVYNCHQGGRVQDLFNLPIFFNT